VRTALVPGLTLWIGPRAGWPGPLWTKKGAAADQAAERDFGEQRLAGGEPVGDEA